MRPWCFANQTHEVAVGDSPSPRGYWTDGPRDNGIGDRIAHLELPPDLHWESVFVHMKTGERLTEAGERVPLIGIMRSQLFHLTCVHAAASWFAPMIGTGTASDEQAREQPSEPDPSH